MVRFRNEMLAEVAYFCYDLATLFDQFQDSAPKGMIKGKKYIEFSLPFLEYLIDLLKSQDRKNFIRSNPPDKAFTNFISIFEQMEKLILIYENKQEKIFNQYREQCYFPGNVLFSTASFISTITSHLVGLLKINERLLRLESSKKDFSFNNEVIDNRIGDRGYYNFIANYIQFLGVAINQEKPSDQLQNEYAHTIKTIGLHNVQKWKSTYEYVASIRESISNMQAIMMPYDVLATLLSQSKNGIKDTVMLEDWLNEIDEETEESLPVQENQVDSDSGDPQVDELEEKLQVSSLSISNPLNEIAIALSPYHTKQSYFVASLRTLVADHYSQKNTIPPHLVKWKNRFDALHAQRNLIASLDMLQSILEQYDPQNHPETSLTLTQLYKLSMNLSFEQLLTAEYRRLFSESFSFTHNIEYMALNLPVKDLEWVRKHPFGTKDTRYPNHYHTPIENITMEEIEADLTEFGEVVKQLFKIDVKPMMEISSMNRQDNALPTEVQQKCAEINETLTKTLSQLQGVILNVKRSRGSLNALKNLSFHLENLSLVPLLMQKHTQQRYLYSHLHLAIFSSQYLIENLGIALTIDKKVKPTHNLAFYQLQNSLSEEQQKLYLDLNCKKGTEYPYGTPTTAKALDDLSDLYIRSRDALDAGEGFSSTAVKEKTLETLQKENVVYLEAITKLVVTLLNQHLFQVSSVSLEEADSTNITK